MRKIFSTGEGRRFQVGTDVMSKKLNNKNSVNVESSLAVRGQDPGFWREIWQQIRLVFYLIRDPEVPFYLKLLPLAAVLYFFWPIDLISDFIPVLGQLDDLTALMVTSKVFIELSPQRIVDRHMHAIRKRDGYAAFSPDGENAEANSEDLDSTIVIDSEHEVIAGNGKE